MESKEADECYKAEKEVEEMDVVVDKSLSYKGRGCKAEEKIGKR